MLGQNFISISLGLSQKKMKLKSGYLELRFSVCFVVRCFVSILVLQSTWWGWGGGARCFAWFVCLVSRGGWAALPHGASGLSAVCDCGIS